LQVGVDVGVFVAVFVVVRVGVRVGLLVGVVVGVFVGVDVGVLVGVLVTVLVGVLVGFAAWVLIGKTTPMATTNENLVIILNILLFMYPKFQIGSDKRQKTSHKSSQVIMSKARCLFPKK